MYSVEDITYWAAWDFRRPPFYVIFEYEKFIEEGHFYVFKKRGTDYRVGMGLKELETRIRHKTFLPFLLVTKVNPPADSYFPQCS